MTWTWTWLLIGSKRGSNPEFLGCNHWFNVIPSVIASNPRASCCPYSIIYSFIFFIFIFRIHWKKPKTLRLICFFYPYLSFTPKLGCKWARFGSKPCCFWIWIHFAKDGFKFGPDFDVEWCGVYQGPVESFGFHMGCHFFISLFC